MDSTGWQYVAMFDGIVLGAGDTVASALQDAQENAPEDDPNWLALVPPALAERIEEEGDAPGLGAEAYEYLVASTVAEIAEMAEIEEAARVDNTRNRDAQKI